MKDCLKVTQGAKAFYVNQDAVTQIKPAPSGHGAEVYLGARHFISAEETAEQLLAQMDPGEAQRLALIAQTGLTYAKYSAPITSPTPVIVVSRSPIAPVIE